MAPVARPLVLAEGVVKPDPFPVADASSSRPATKRRVLLLALHNSYRIGAYSEAARLEGIELVIASQGRHSLVPEAAGGLHIDLQRPANAVKRISAEAQREPFVAVVACEDGTVELASRVAHALGLKHNPPQASRITRRKDLARAALASQGIPVPYFRRIDLAADLSQQITGIPYPCVAKPLALSASRGVIRANNPTELIAACRRISTIVQTEFDEEIRRYALVEQFLPGVEVAVEGILFDGQLQILALFDKPDPLDGPYFEETYYVTPSRLSRAAQEQIHQQLRAACDAYGLQEGPIHAELRIADDQAWIIEVAARTIGGDCARLLQFETGVSLEQLVLRCALREPVQGARLHDAAGVMMIPTPRAGVLRRVEGVLAARKVTYIEAVEITIRAGYELTPLPEGGTYLGFIFARGPTPYQVEDALRQAYQKLNVVVAPMWRLASA
ncbi:MAG: ATP-grasp domain-containing protein [Gammaproteobacteria bacterium]